MSTADQPLADGLAPMRESPEMKDIADVFGTAIFMPQDRVQRGRSPGKGSDLKLRVKDL